MRILHVIPAIAERYGGPSVAVVQMARALRDRGHAAEIATTDADGDRRLAVELGRTIDRGGVPTTFFRRRQETIKYAVGLSSWLARRVGDYDVVHVHAVFGHPCWAAARAARRAGVPYVVRPLGTLDPWSLRRHAFRKRLYWAAVGRRIVALAAERHYTTEAEKRAVETRLGVFGGAVVPIGVDDELFTAPRSGKEGPAGEFGSRYVLALCRLDPKKGLDRLIEAFRLLDARGRLGGWRLVIAGRGRADYAEALRRAAAPLGERVVFAGWLEGERKRLALRDAELLALPSFQENFGICIAEALASGVPVLVSDRVDLASEIAAWGAGWVAAPDPPAIAAALERALSDERERRRRAENAAIAGSRFRKGEMARALEEMYRRVAAPAAGRRIGKGAA